MNNIDIFIRTYTKDFDILQYCLYSIEKYVKGYKNIIITVKENEYALLQNAIDITKYKIFTTPNYTSLYSNYYNIDYLGQQLDKLSADLYSDADYILYVDCDIIFHNNINLNEVCFDENNKVILFRTLWKNVGDANRWRKCLIELNLLNNYEYMRRLPQLFPIKYLKDIRNYIEFKTNKTFINACVDFYIKCGFSEFNIIGSYIHKYHNTEMHLCNTEEEDNNKYIYNYKLPCVTQLWSHTEKKKLLQSIKELLHISDINIAI